MGFYCCSVFYRLYFICFISYYGVITAGCFYTFNFKGFCFIFIYLCVYTYRIYVHVCHATFYCSMCKITRATLPPSGFSPADLKTKTSSSFHLNSTSVGDQSRCCGAFSNPCLRSHCGKWTGQGLNCGVLRFVSELSGT